MKHRAPRVLAVIVAINEILRRRGLTREDFAQALNKFLPAQRRIKLTHTGMVQVFRWLDITAKGWSEPLGEIALAMKAFLDENTGE